MGCTFERALPLVTETGPLVALEALCFLDRGVCAAAAHMHSTEKSTNCAGLACLDGPDAGRFCFEVSARGHHRRVVSEDDLVALALVAASIFVLQAIIEDDVADDPYHNVGQDYGVSQDEPWRVF